MSFHWYGFLVGCAVLVGGWIAELKARKYKVDSAFFERALWVCISVGFISARLWHVMTEITFYADNLMDIFFVWQGGMSIIGGVVGSVLALLIYAHAQRRAAYVWQFLDIATFALPVAQAIGRLGNYVNQELFGVPTELPWKIFITVENRPVQFQNQSYFHPLFAYEMIATLCFAGCLWMLEQKKYDLHVGSGTLAQVYIVYYAVVRFGLDFLRPDRGVLLYNLGFNQVFLLGVLIVFCVLLLRKVRLWYAV